MNKRKILILGYYNRHNRGDDVFEHVLTNFFQENWEKSGYIFLCIDDLKEITSDTSCVIVGGGDLVNDYFFTKLKPFLTKKTCPWYAISIGIPYPNLIEKGYLDSFDYIVHRNQEDIPLLTKKYPGRTHWYPDLSFLLPTYKTNNYEIEFPSSCSLNRTKKIGVFLSRHIYSFHKIENYNRIVANLAKFLSDVSLIKNKWKKPLYEIYLIPFCTDGKDSSDDRKINKDVYDTIKDYGDSDNVHLFEDELNMNKIIPIFNSFHMTICTRFHAHMFSLISKVPILSIYTTRKVENFLEEIGAKDYSVKMETDALDYPTFLDNKVLSKKFLKIEHEYNLYSSKLETIHNLYTKEIQKFTGLLNNLLFYLPRSLLPNEIDIKASNLCMELAKKFLYMKKDLLGLDIINNKSVKDMMNMKENKLVKIIKINRIKNARKSNNEINKLITINGYIGQYFKNSKINKTNIADLISYVLTGERKSEYHYGLEQQIFTSSYNLFESCKWILHHFNSKTEYNYLENETGMSLRKLNFEYINFKIFTGYHRSGWSYVLNSMKNLHNPEGIIFDSYLDKTFGWEYDFLSSVQVIPYRKSWIGVFHHTSDEDYSENNLVNVFEKDNFIESLKYCKGLIVFSENNKKWLNSRTKVPVLVLSHPTEFVPKKSLFNYKKFKSDPAKKIIQVGAWLRNSYAIYELTVPNEYHKFAMKGKDMDNYFFSESNIALISENIKLLGYNKKDRVSGNPFINDRISGQPVKNADVNKYAIGLANLIVKNHKSVTILDNITNDQYDQILTSNIVFINLADAAAVNTIIECIVRNTPIVVNRLPATEEYLGKNYPLFYDNLSEVSKVLTNKKIKKATKYLRKMDKNRFSIDFFLKNLINSKIYYNL